MARKTHKIARAQRLKKRKDKNRWKGFSLVRGVNKVTIKRV